MPYLCSALVIAVIAVIVKANFIERKTRRDAKNQLSPEEYSAWVEARDYEIEQDAKVW